MFVVDRPQFDRHPLDDRHTRLLCGGRVVMNSLESTDWARGWIGASEWPDGSEVGYEVCPWEAEMEADVVLLGDHLGLLPTGPRNITFPDIGEIVLLTPATVRAVAWRDEIGHPWREEVQPLRETAVPPITRGRLVRAWSHEAGRLVSYDRRREEPTAPARLPAVLRSVALAADPGELPAALAAVGRVADWAAADPGAPAPGTLHAPADAGPALTFYLDDEGFPGWPALTADGAGALLDGWAFRPAGLSS